MASEQEHDEAERLYLRVRRRLPPGGEDELNEIGAAIVFAVVAAIIWAIAAVLGAGDLGPIVVGFFAVMWLLYVGIDYSSG